MRSFGRGFSSSRWHYISIYSPNMVDNICPNIYLLSQSTTDVSVNTMTKTGNLKRYPAWCWYQYQQCQSMSIIFREGSDFELKYPLVETHLKLIYTATTRCIEQLFFAETSSSIAGDAVTRWLTTAKPSNDDTTHNTEAIATHNNVSDLDSMIMTDCWYRQCRTSFFAWYRLGTINKLSQQGNILPWQGTEFWACSQSKYTPPKCSDTIQKHCTKCVFEAIEREVAQLTRSLLKEDLLSECSKLLDYIDPYLSTYTKEKLEEKIIAKIQA